ncbi:hypothetical protein [Nocardioides litoris]|uniref:hypothetical protein n=1 Tax=Nocardioides litoris TaxID=1926648 RepID=UPI00112366D1|nr:hypothetical protein [Nocardioides litoris]
MFHPATRRVAPGLAGAALLVASLTACGGGGDSAPEDASQEEFCQAFNARPGDGGEPSVDEVHDYADKLEEVGTPESVTGDARSGYEVFVDFLSSIDDGDIEDLQSDDPESSFSGEEEKQVEAFFSSDALTECVSADLPDTSDLPTDLPTDLPS